MDIEPLSTFQHLPVICVSVQILTVTYALHFGALVTPRESLLEKCINLVEKCQFFAAF